MGATESRGLARLARARGVMPSFRDAAGHVRRVSAETLLATLRALGEEVQRPEDAAAALREVEREQAATPVAPVIVAWDGRMPVVPWRGRVSGPVRCRWGLESGASVESDAEVRAGPPVSLVWPRGFRLPIGVHHLNVHVRGGGASATVLSAPSRVYTETGSRDLGLFLPLYALRTNRDWGVGDLSGLERLAIWAAGRGVAVTGTLPLLATYLDQPFEPSPYSPASRIFWNELYLDPTCVPELARSSEARRIMSSVAFEREVARLRRASLVDYGAAMRLKRRVLMVLADAAFAVGSMRRAELERFGREDEHLESYARFRAVTDRRRAAWPSWPARERRGDLRPGDYDERERGYHIYVQWLLRHQLGAVAGRAAAEGASLYLDLPIGVNGGGFDVWRFREEFATGASVGAPPDLLHSAGQNWGFPPPHPRTQREHGYAYYRACIENHMRYARVLRIDHVMGLHRLYWIPQGADAQDGAYVEYPADELYAVLSILSHRYKCRIVGENLGTVPPEVNRSMRRRGVLGMHIAQFEMGPRTVGAIAEPEPDVLASLNTHDLPTFRAFWTGADTRQRKALGVTDRAQAAAERRDRDAIRRAVLGRLRRDGVRSRTPKAVLYGILDRLAAASDELLLVSLEDLWLEPEPQNIPGVAEGYPNWRRKAKLTYEQVIQDRSIKQLLQRLARLRRIP